MWGTGPKQAKVMIVYDAPGDLEDRNGKHLQGRPGKILNEMLEAAGIDREQCYITSLVKCHPPEGRAPSKSEAKTCKPFLDKEIADVKPTHMLTLGATVLGALSKKAKITELHGMPFDYQGITVVPTFSPAMALRDPTRLPTLRKDVVKLGHVMRGDMPRPEDIHWRVIRTLKDWHEFIEEFKKAEVFAADIETNGLDEHEEGSTKVVETGKVRKKLKEVVTDAAVINSIQIGLDNGHNWALPLQVKPIEITYEWYGPSKANLRQKLVETLVELSEGKICVGQNFKFDNRWIRKLYGVRFHLSFDTMLAHHLIDENSPHGLKEMAAEFCNAPNYDIPEHLKQGRFKNASEERLFYRYGCLDVNYTQQLYWIFRKVLLKDPTQRRLFYKLVMRAARMFEDVETDGHFINLESHSEAKKKLIAEKIDLLRQMNKMAGREINWNSPQQVGELFYKKLGLPVLEKTPGGAPSTDESVLLRLKHKHPVADLLMKFRGVDKNLSTYIEGWEKLMHGDRLFLSTKLHGTVTGRYASRLHQVPRDPFIRSLIDAPEGWTFVSGDYSQIELRIAAMLSNDKRMKEIFQTGGDIHRATASIILGKPPEAVTKEERKMAKAVNFGLVYGMGWPKLVIYARDNYEVDLTDEQAQKFRIRFFELYNALPKWHERQRRCVRAFGQVVSLSGRIRHLPGVNSSEKGVRAEAERQGINSPVQGFGSGDMKAMAMVEIHDTFDPKDLRIKGEVHDSILMWIRTSRLKQIIPRCKAIMEKPKLLEEFGIKMTVPIVADFEVGAWGKGTELKGPLNKAIDAYLEAL